MFPNFANDEDWKKDLRSTLIVGMTGSEKQKIEAYGHIGYYYKCCAPAYLYKFYSDNDRDLNTVKNNKMWYPAPAHFNDIFDCDIIISEKEILESILHPIEKHGSIRKGSVKWRELQSSVAKECRNLKHVFEGFKSTTGISCFSETNESLLMWAHYANDHKGMCVEYELMEINKQLKFSPVPVIYSDDRIVIHSINEEKIEEDTTRALVESLTSKSLEWSYEREWRIIRDETACGDTWDKDKKGALLDMISPSSIILGCMASSEFEAKVHNYCKESKINLYKMRKNPIYYRLEKEPILLFDDE